MNRLPRTDANRRQLVTETALVLGVSLGASAIWAVLALIRKLTEQVGLGDQTTAMNEAVTRTARGSTSPISWRASGSRSFRPCLPCTC